MAKLQIVTEMQVQLLTVTKANTGEAVAGVKESDLISGAGHLEVGVTHVLKPTSPFQWRQRFFIWRKRGAKQRDQGEG